MNKLLGPPSSLKVEIDRQLSAVADPPTGWADLHPCLAAKLGQFWLVAVGRPTSDSTAAGIFGPEPMVHTPTLTGTPGADAVRFTPVAGGGRERCPYGQVARRRLERPPVRRSDPEG